MCGRFGFVRACSGTGTLDIGACALLAAARRAISRVPRLAVRWAVGRRRDLWLKAAALHGLLSLVNAGVRAGLAPTMTDNFLHQSASWWRSRCPRSTSSGHDPLAQLLRADGERLAEELRSGGKAAMGIPVQRATPLAARWRRRARHLSPPSG